MSDPLSAEAERRAGAVLTVDLAAIAENYRRLRARVAPDECAAVVKADAYGLGLDPVAPTLWRAGARTFFVAQLTEAIALRGLLPTARIGVLGGLMPGCEGDYLAHDLVPTLNHLGELERWRAAARQTGRRLPAYLHIDTGMTRLGLDRPELDRLATEWTLLDGVEILAWMSHLACADMPEHPQNGRQQQRFAAALARLPQAPGSLANSSGIFLGPEFGFGLARPGCALYGVNPTPGRPSPMTHPVRLDGRVLQVRRVDAGDGVGYGASHEMPRDGIIATISIGYADGFLRSLSNRGAVWVGEQAAPLVGRVSMDLITADVTDLPLDAVRPGRLVEVIGPHRSLDAVAADAGTIGYEVLTSLGQRYARRYLSFAPEPEPAAA